MSAPTVSAAGGVVIDDDGAEPKVAVVHRPQYDDWSLPKGKLEPGESWSDGALREVEEETGLRCELGPELEPARYRDRKGRDKLVRWWLMRPLGGEFVAGDEVDELRWLSLAEALDLLDYAHDRELLRSLP
ncbi:MAG TPA: NUDIX hydrolase [Solirubrobacterales bacterium]|jgi:8-oxo-dGTP diphosphatase